MYVIQLYLFQIIIVYFIPAGKLILLNLTFKKNGWHQSARYKECGQPFNVSVKHIYQK